MAKLANSKWEEDQNARIKKLENDLTQQKRRISTLEKRADRDDALVEKLKRRISNLENRETVKTKKK